jgi:hypothetical protein
LAAKLGQIKPETRLFRSQFAALDSLGNLAVAVRHRLESVPNPVAQHIFPHCLIPQTRDTEPAEAMEAPHSKFVQELVPCRAIRSFGRGWFYSRS